MSKINLMDDYSEGCHPRILEILAETNLTQQEGYGEDVYSREARQLIRGKINCSDADVFFVSGGTQANLIVVAATLRPHESVIAVDSGHINVHEAGAIEATGHRINSVPGMEGKMRVEDIQAVLEGHADVPHMVKPKMVYISNSTEVGTCYLKNELEDLSEFCRENELFLFMDGARLGSALCADGNDLSLADVAELTDVFYIGGTKNGALLGEAIVITNNSIKEDFPFHLKQHGALTAKGRLLGIQFVALFRDDLFFELATHANRMAGFLTVEIRERDYPFLVETSSNQIFPIFPDTRIKQLAENYAFHTWQRVDDTHSAVRLVTSWATERSVVDQFVVDLG
ncbi:threonine aldolase family protein, partial [Desulfomarina sp.]